MYSILRRIWLGLHLDFLKDIAVPKVSEPGSEICMPSAAIYIYMYTTLVIWVWKLEACARDCVREAEIRSVVYLYNPLYLIKIEYHQHPVYS